jgi:probable HAF family extracellular repeat protein
MSHRFAVGLCVLSFLLSMVAGDAWGIAPYTVTDLGTLGGTPGGGSSRAYGINDYGTIVGCSTFTTNPTFGSEAFIYRDGVMTALPYAAAPGTTMVSSVGYDVNDRDQVAGAATCALYVNGYITYAAYFTTETATVIASGTVNLTPASANGISYGGVIVGTRAIVNPNTGSSGPQAFQYSSGELDDIAIAGSAANDINARGDIVGYGTFPSGISQAYWCRGGVVENIDTLGSASSCAWAIDSTYWPLVVGGAYLSEYSKEHAFVFTTSGHAMTDIGLRIPGVPWSCAYGVNDYGTSVGAFGDSDYHAFVCEGGAGGYPTDLNWLIDPGSGWTLSEARGINNSGRVVGWGVNSAGQTHALLMAPALPGDASLDGTVNGADLNTVLSNYNKTVTQDVNGWMMGDFNGDGTVNGTDLNAVLSNYNQSNHVDTAGAAVPEPSALALLVVGAISLLAYVRRRRKGTA